MSDCRAPEIIGELYGLVRADPPGLWVDVAFGWRGVIRCALRLPHQINKVVQYKEREIAHLVMSHNDRYVNELAPSGGGEGGIGWELVMCCVYVGRVAEIVGVPRKC